MADIDTSALDDDTDLIGDARSSLLQTVQRVNSLAAPSGAGMVGGGDQIVSSIAGLRGLLKTSPSKNAFVTGYYAAGDGGGGAYWYDSSDTTSTDNGGTVIVATDGGRWKLDITGLINIRQFGAKGDGTADDAPAINSCIAWAFTRNQIDGGAILNILGDAVYCPAGRYLLKSYIKLLPGISLKGVQSGLVSQTPSAAGTGTIFALSATVSGGGAWTTTTVTGGITHPYAIMFYTEDGGPIQLENLAFIGTSTATPAVCIWSGETGGHSRGWTQGLINGCRITAFSTGIYAYKFFDVTINNTGFEYNTVDIQSDYSASSLGGFSGNYISDTVFFGHQYSLVGGGSAADLSNNVFSNCVFQSVDVGAGKVALTNNGSLGGFMSNNQFTGCSFDYNAGYAVADITNNCQISGIFVGCKFKKASFNFPYVVDAIQNLSRMQLIGCQFEDSNITVTYEFGRITIVGNDFKGNSALSFSSLKNAVINSNNFTESTNSGFDITLSDIGSDFSIEGNVFRNGAGGVSTFNTSTARYKILGNVNQTNFTSAEWATVTAGSGGWTNHATTPQFYKDNSGFVRMRGMVTNTTPAAYSIMCTLPASFAPEVSGTFMLPESGGTGYVIAAISTDNNLYFISKSGTGSNYDLSPISFKPAQ